MTHRFVFPKKIIGPYEYFEDKVIGRGTSSITYEGNRIESGQRVCIKKIDLINSTLQRFVKAEIQVFKRVQHENIVGFLGYFQRGSSVYIVTELCDMNLQQKLKKQRQFEEMQALTLFFQVLEGYEALRNRGFIHRDIKPENILIQNGKVKLADFGYCLLLNKRSISEPFNIGTPLYMAPEALFSNSYSQKSDIWSLGVTLYQMMFGTVPFLSKSQDQLKKQIKQPIKLNYRTLSEKILKQCLQYDQERRYDLQHLLLDVKVALHKLHQQQRNNLRQAQDNTKETVCFLNQLNYVRFLEYIKFLATHTTNLNLDIKSRIIYLFEYTIRIRLGTLEKYTQKEYKQLLPQRLIESLNSIKRKHEFQIERPENLKPNDRLLFFKQEKPVYKKSIQWQIQAELKDQVRIVMRGIGKRLNEYSANVEEQMIKLADFLLSAFLLNRILIQKDNSAEQFAKSSQLRTILSSPCRINAQVWDKVVAKAAELDIT